MSNRTLHHWIGTITISILLLGMTTANANEVSLRTVSAFAKGSSISDTFEQFVKRVNEDETTQVELDFIGGPEVMPPFQLGNAVRSGVVDVAFVPGAFYTNLMPVADALKLSEYSPWELRDSGAWEEIVQMWHQGMNVHYLAFTNYGNTFQLYLTKPVDNTDLSGLKLRITPVYRAFFRELGATVVQTPPGQVYTALERGVVDGYGWPIQGIFDLGWQEQTDYRVEPGFYTVEVGVLVNLDTWRSLTDQQRAYLTKQAKWLELLDRKNPKINSHARARQKEAGIETIRLDGEARETFVTTAYEAGWAEILQQAPDKGTRLRKLISK